MKKDDLLLIVDMQNVYARGGKWECLDTEGAAQNLQKIIAHGLKNVIFTRFIANETSPKGVWADYNKKYSDVNSDFYANQMLKEFEPSLKKFPLYTKNVYSSLAIPEVLEACKKAGTSWVVVEQDQPTMNKTPLESIKMSIDYLKTINK